jgi:O-antigen/teichoic acid export membrane protein
MIGFTDEHSQELGSQARSFPRLSRRGKTVQSVTMQFLALGLAVVQGFLLTPLCLRHIDYKLFGAWLATGQMLSWVSLLDPGVNEVLRQRVAHAFGGGDKQRLGSILGSGLAVGFCIAVIPTLAGLAAVLVIPRFISLGHAESVELQQCFLAAACATGLTIASFAPGSALQGLQRHILHGTVSLLGALSYLISAIALLYAGWGLAAIPAALLIRGVVWIVGWTLPVLWISKRELGIALRMKWTEGRQTLGKSAATGLSNIGVTLQTGTDIFIAGAMVGPESAATLSLTGALGDFIRLVPDRIVASFLPGMAHLAGEGDLNKFRTISWRLVQVILALLALALGAVVIANETFVKHWVGAKSYGGLALTAALCLAVTLFSACNLLGVILFSLGIIKAPALVRFGQSLFQIALVFLLIHRIKLLAIPVALAVAAAVGLATFFIREYSSAVHSSDALAREQWKWFWLPLLGSLGLAAGIAVALRPQTIVAAALAVILYWVADGCFLLAINKTLRLEARELFTWMSATASLAVAR